MTPTPNTKSVEVSKKLKMLNQSSRNQRRALKVDHTKINQIWHNHNLPSHLPLLTLKHGKLGCRNYITMMAS
jgi:hypothetical protein